MSAPENPPAPFTLMLFGPMQVLVEGRPLPRMRSRKGLWLLALLILRHDRPVKPKATGHSEQVRSLLGEATFAAAREAGRAMSWE